jgi:hypothetical protein
MAASSLESRLSFLSLLSLLPFSSLSIPIPSEPFEDITSKQHFRTSYQTTT